MRWKCNGGRNIFRLALLLPTLLLSCVLILGAPRVSAASVGTINILGPTSGPVGTLVTLEVRQYPSVPTMYNLAATPTSPDQGGCGSAQSVQGVASFQVDPNRGADVQFHWPASLGRGTYWFCAISVDGSAPAAMSQASAPFTVLTDAVPTVKAIASSSVAQPGSAISVTVSNWLTSDDAAPANMVLLHQGDLIAQATAITAQATGSTDSSTGAYAFTATLPSYIAVAGQYAVVVQGECGSDPLGTGKMVCAVTTQSSFFAVAQSPAPTPLATSAATGPAQTSPERGQTDGSNASMSWIGPVLGLILLALIVGMVVVLVRRANTRKQQELQQQQARSTRYRSGDWQQPSRYDQRYDSQDRW